MKSPLSRPSSSSFNQEMERKDYSLPVPVFRAWRGLDGSTPRLSWMQRSGWDNVPYQPAGLDVVGWTVVGNGYTAVWLSPMTQSSLPLAPRSVNKSQLPPSSSPSPATVNIRMAASPPLPSSVQSCLSLTSFCSGAWALLPLHLQSQNSTIFLFKWMFVKCFSSRGWVEN